jgi:hypothetical protein
MAVAGSAPFRVEASVSFGKRYQAKGRLKSGVMNKSETRYGEYLWSLQIGGDVLWYLFEGMTFKLAEGLRYTPDFAVLRSDGILECVDVKGRTTVATGSGERKEAALAMDDSRQKVKMAASLFPLVFAVVFQSKTGEWVREEF